MFDLGFSMEELMFPENYQFHLLSNTESNQLDDRLDDRSPSNDPQQQMVVDDDDEDWLARRQLYSHYDPLTDASLSLTDDQILPPSQSSSRVGHAELMTILEKDMDSSVSTKLSIRISREKTNSSPYSEISAAHCSSLGADQRLLVTTRAMTPKQQPSMYPMSKSISSLSFGIQSSNSTTSSSLGDRSPNSNDFNEVTILNYPTSCSKELYHPTHHTGHSPADASSSMHRRRRKRTIFTVMDIEHLKEAFTQNPKPNQQDIAVLSEQLGHDSYVIRVWFYNKRQASKKRLE